MTAAMRASGGETLSCRTLLFAFNGGHYDGCLKLLIAAGANLNRRDKVRKCPTASEPVKCAYGRIVVVIASIGRDGRVEGLVKQPEGL